MGGAVFALVALYNLHFTFYKKLQMHLYKLEWNTTTVTKYCIRSPLATTPVSQKTTTNIVSVSQTSTIVPAGKHWSR